jgi:nicotinamidase-related amidase
MSGPIVMIGQRAYQIAALSKKLNIQQQDLSKAALIIIDNQEGSLYSNWFGTERSTPRYEENITTLVAAFRYVRQADTGTPHIIHIYHRSVDPPSPLYPGKPTAAPHPTSAPIEGEAVFFKDTISALQLLDLTAFIIDNGIARIYFAGISLDHSVGSTMRHLSDLRILNHVMDHISVRPGDIVLIDDAVAVWAKHEGKYRAEQIHAHHTESLSSVCARITNTRDVLTELGLVLR